MQKRTIVHLQMFLPEHLELQLTEIDLDLMDVDKIIGFQSLNNILDWEHLYSADGGETSWLVTLYFDDGSFFQSTENIIQRFMKNLKKISGRLFQRKQEKSCRWMRGERP